MLMGMRSFGSGVALCAMSLGFGGVAGAQFFPTGGETQANAYTTGSQGSPEVSVSPTGEFVIVWRSFGQDGSEYGVFGRRFTSEGAPNGGEFPINTTTNGHQESQNLDLDQDGNFVVVWDSTQNGAGDIFGRRFFFYGQAIGVEFQINSYSTGHQLNPDVGVRSNGDFVVVWDSSGEDGDSIGVFARRYDSAGAALAAPFMVNVQTLGAQAFPAIDVDDDGGFVVAWSNVFTVGNDGIWARRFSSSGVPQGAEFRMSVSNASQGDAQVALAPDSTFVVVWNEYLADGSFQGIVARRGSASGAPLATEFLVNSYTSGFQTGPSIAMEGDGDFVIAWQSETPSSAFDMIAQRFGASGARFGGEFTVNSYRPSTQSAVSVAAHPARPEFVIAWGSPGQDGNGNGVFFQRYAGVSIDIDGNGGADPLSDGLLFLRYLFGFRGATLITGAVAGNCTRCTAPEIEAFIDGIL